eukprot:TRINITY_DN21637_c0_g1_i1.p1 TRINITY_DN21637_c0_g1~~TRINITY_DN21637_c0_g1_i1.p1  ORF type:complete len:440 (+),score=74.00 TRINITY_DN21637_c0_g1_i1:189-1508(+)
MTGKRSIEINVIAARDLIIPSGALFSSRYVTASIGKYKGETKAVNQSPTPEWNQVLKLQVVDPSTAILEMLVIAQHFYSQKEDRPLGMIRVPLNSFQNEVPINSWYHLTPPPRPMSPSLGSSTPKSFGEINLIITPHFQKPESLPPPKRLPSCIPSTCPKKPAAPPSQQPSLMNTPVRKTAVHSKAAPQSHRCICDDCSSSATIYCVEDEEFYCAGHAKEQHRMGKRRYHTLMAASDHERRHTTCKSHPRQDLTQFCTKCEVLACSECVPIHHRASEGHQVLALEDVVNDRRKKLAENIPFLEHMRDSLQKTSQSVASHRESIYQSHVDTCTEINREYDEAIAVLEKKRVAHLQDATRHRTLEINRLSSFNDAVSDRVRILNDAMQKIKSSRESPANWISMEPLLRSQVDALIASEPLIANYDRLSFVSDTIILTPHRL